MYLVDIGLEDDVIVSAYGYFNEDKYCDIVTTIKYIVSCITVWETFYWRGGARANMQPANQSRLPQRILNITAIPYLQFWVF